MVDRPIKKSDRKADQQANPTDDQPKAARNTPKPVKKGDRTDGETNTSDSQGSREDRGRGGKGRGKGRGKGKDDAPKTPMNPALMRGPKPTQKVEAVEEVAAEEAATEEAAEETATGEEAVEGTTEGTATAEPAEETADEEKVAATDTEA